MTECSVDTTTVICELTTKTAQLPYEITLRHLYVNLEGAESVPANAPGPSKQPRLDGMFRPFSTQWQSRVTAALVSYIVEGMRPLISVENDNFRCPVHELEPKYEMPPEDTVTRLIKAV